MTFVSDGPFETQEDLNAIKQKITNPDDFMVSSKCQVFHWGFGIRCREVFGDLFVCFRFFHVKISLHCNFCKRSAQKKKKKKKSSRHILRPIRCVLLLAVIGSLDCVFCCGYTRHSGGGTKCVNYEQGKWLVWRQQIGVHSKTFITGIQWTTYFSFPSSKTELYIQDMLTNRDDEKEATGAYVDAFVSKDNVRVSDDKPTDTAKCSFSKETVFSCYSMGVAPMPKWEQNRWLEITAVW